MIRKYSEAEEGNKDKKKKIAVYLWRNLSFDRFKKSRYKGDTFEKKKAIKTYPV